MFDSIVILHLYFIASAQIATQFFLWPVLVDTQVVRFCMAIHLLQLEKLRCSNNDFFARLLEFIIMPTSVNNISFTSLHLQVGLSSEFDKSS